MGSTQNDQLNKSWTVIYNEFKKADVLRDDFYIKKKYYHGFIFRYNHKNYELASYLPHGEDFFKIKTWAVEVRGNAEKSTDISKISDLECFCKSGNSV